MDDALSPKIVLHGYQMGVFPMADETGEIFWYSPDPRGVFEYDKFKIPRSLRPILRSRRFEIRVDTAFDEVLHACANREGGTWISAEVAKVYCEMHRRGFAHSVETWLEGELAGGLYGIAIGGAFFGESMFHRVADASKVALVALVERLKQRGFTLIDTQWITPHLERFGAIEIPRTEYLQRLGKALSIAVRFVD